MKSAVLIIGLLMLPVFGNSGQEVLAKDSNGLVVEVKEKYGGYYKDTCTVLMHYNKNFVLIKREGKSAWFPSAFHSVKVVERFSKKEEFLASKESAEKRDRLF